MKPALYLHSSKESSMRRGHPWVFPKAINQIKEKPCTGELVQIFSSQNEWLGIGVYNEHSLYRVRVLAMAWEVEENISLVSLINIRLKNAQLLRQHLNLPNADTTAFRFFNSEADGLSGLTIDCFNNIYIVASSAYWVEKNRKIITDCLAELTDNSQIIWLSQVKPLSQDGWKTEETTQYSTSSIEVLEAGVSLQVNFNQAQKTGLFIDQRENHQRIAALAKGKRVLDLYTYTGGFALHAAKAGAAKVVAVDSSAQAIEQAQQNAIINQLQDKIEFMEADARNYLTQAGEFDIVILDPPKLVPSMQHLQRAKNYYRFLHREVFKVMKPGSLLMTCNCSSALSSEEFCQLISQQAIYAQRRVNQLGVYGPASCHPTLAAFPEGNYLTAVLLAVA